MHKRDKRDEYTYQKCWECRVAKPCIVNCPHTWEIVKGKHYIKEEKKNVAI